MNEQRADPVFRLAVEADLEGLVALLADDDLGAAREDASLPLKQDYIDAFHSIDRDPNNELIVIEDRGNIVGMLQLTFIPYLSRLGSWRCLIESVRIARERRGAGLGTSAFTWAIDRAREKGCGLVQLTSDKQRPNALRFYESLGFRASHEGFKLRLRGNG